MDKISLLNSIDKLKQSKILVIGDFAIDEMIYGDTERISREAPVLILLHSHTNIILGAASNAAHNISTVNGGRVLALGVYGNDYHAPILLKTMEEAGISTKYMIQDSSRPTTVKTRISGKCSQSVTQQVVRIDRQSTLPLSAEIEKKVLDNMENAIKECDGIILSDYHLGFLTDKIIENAIVLAKKHNKIIVADVQKDFEKYKGVTAITPNMPDSEKYVGYFIKNDDDLTRAGSTIIEKLNLKNLLITKGAEGMTLFEAGSTVTQKSIPAFNKKEVFDVTGAGDTVVAVFTLALCAGLTPYVAMVLGNLAASIVIRQFGCHSITIQEMIDEINSSGVQYGF